MCPYVHYILDDASAAKESCDLLHTPQQQAYFDSHLKESIENPISCIQADLRGFALEKVCGSRYRAVLIDPPWSISMKVRLIVSALYNTSLFIYSFRSHL